MLFRSLKNKIFKKKLLNLIAAYTKKRVVTNKNINTVAVLTVEDVLVQKHFQSQLPKVLGVKEIKTYAFRNFDKKNEPSPLYFSEKDFGMKAKVFDTDFQQFLETPFDLLITYFTDKNQYLECATVLSKATFKVGFANVNSDLFDMEIVGNINNLEEFNLELIRYLKILNKLN